MYKKIFEFFFAVRTFNKKLIQDKIKSDIAIFAWTVTWNYMRPSPRNSDFALNRYSYSKHVGNI